MKDVKNERAMLETERQEFDVYVLQKKKEINIELAKVEEGFANLKADQANLDKAVKKLAKDKEGYKDKIAKSIVNNVKQVRS